MENEIYFKAVQFEKKTITDFEKWYLKEKEKIIEKLLIDLKNKNILKTGLNPLPKVIDQTTGTTLLDKKENCSPIS